MRGEQDCRAFGTKLPGDLPCRGDPRGPCPVVGSSRSSGSGRPRVARARSGRRFSAPERFLTATSLRSARSTIETAWSSGRGPWRLRPICPRSPSRSDRRGATVLEHDPGACAYRLRSRTGSSPPKRRMLPLVGPASPSRSSTVKVLPAPLVPSRASSSPRTAERSPRTAVSSTPRTAPKPPGPTAPHLRYRPVTSITFCRVLTVIDSHLRPSMTATTAKTARGSHDGCHCGLLHGSSR